MKKNIYVSVSTDPIKEYQKITEYAKEMQGKADMLHCDVMDGHFVSNETYDYNLIKSLNDNGLIMLDVHLMIDQPEMIYLNYIKSGANILTVHYEAIANKEVLPIVIRNIQESGTLAGIAINPETSFKEIKMFLFDVDLVLVMSVEPGASGQKFMPETLQKIKELDKFRQDNNLTYKIEVDGGVNEQNAKSIIEAGADILVSGNYVYNSQDREKAIENLKNCVK